MTHGSIDTERGKSRGKTGVRAKRPARRGGRTSATGSEKKIAIRNELVVEYHQFVEEVVDRLIRWMKFPKALRDEFISAGYLGLVEAASRFDPSRGRNFKAFAFLRIRGSIIDSIRATNEYSGASYRVIKTLEAVNDLRTEVDDQTGGVGLSAKERARSSLLFLSKSLIAFKLSALQSGTFRQMTTPSDELEKELDKKRNAQKIRDIVATLPEKERTIIEQYYFHDRKLIEVAEQLTGLSKSWVSRLHDRALGMLKEKFEKQIPELL